MAKLFEKETYFYKRTWNPLNLKEEGLLIFKMDNVEFKVHDYDWYIIVALEKAEKVTSDREQLTSKLLLEYRWAIREGYQHELDKNLKNRFDYPRNKNTIEGIKSYIKK
ncbi:hypothetical protein [Empedobacter falsenii]|uniref:Uncharacterized protein n=1 Tax=Empedobacter falsenii TaxID=343874 RepID=A0A376G230_9FLAO|nr:hypothetical protein [Empedobacter falsenii]STD53057.1 Uncharacterised protein [Empedobacter falsenii]